MKLGRVRRGISSPTSWSTRDDSSNHRARPGTLAGYGPCNQDKYRRSIPGCLEQHVQQYLSSPWRILHSPCWIEAGGSVS